MSLPSETCLKQASKLAIEKDKPILLDYYMDSIVKQCRIVKNAENEKFLFKNKDEYTSPLVAMFKCSPDVILETQNSLYIVSSKIF